MSFVISTIKWSLFIKAVKREVFMQKKKIFVSIFLILLTNVLFAQQPQPAPQKFALVIGNGAYANIARLNNPVNDANDMAATLRWLGFSVDLLTNANLEQIENAVKRFKNKLSASKNCYGFLFFAGHGVQAQGENYLIPVDANIQNDTQLRLHAMSVQSMLEDLNNAGNALNIVVLDACRDNPFSYSRSSNRGLTVVNYQPADSIIVFATAAGATASDGSGRNGLFTGHLINNLKKSGIEVRDVFRLTHSDVRAASGDNQRPALYDQYGGRVYLNGEPSQLQPVPGPAAQIGSKDSEAALWTIGASVGTSFAAPWVIGTIHGTIAPFKYSFMELGADYGMVSGNADAESYFSFYPFVHYAFFKPFKISGGWYAGIGGGYMLGEYTFPEEKIPVNVFAFDATAGVNIKNRFNISYTMRTDFTSVNNKLAVGYTYRFNK